MTDWDAGERGMTPDEWAGVFEAGVSAALSGDKRPSRDDLAAVLRAMADECRRVKRMRDSRHG